MREAAQPCGPTLGDAKAAQPCGPTQVAPAYNSRVRVALAQINTTVGALERNAQRILDAAAQASAQGCDLLVTPELALTGYPPQDLLYFQHFVREQRDLLYNSLAPRLSLPALIGFVEPAELEVKADEPQGSLYNAAAFVQSGAVREVRRKVLLPTYDVFDEWRYFIPGEGNEPVTLTCRDGSLALLGVTICEDIWDREYQRKVTPGLAERGAQVLINLSSSPFHAAKGAQRYGILRRHAAALHLPVLYCNLVGGQDELIFDGQSLAVDCLGSLVACGSQFAEELVVVDLDPHSGELRPVSAGGDPSHVLAATGFDAGEVYGALVLGIRDYFAKCGFQRAVLGLSGGIDSAVCACLTADALGSENVVGLIMPSRYNAEASMEDAQALAAALDLRTHMLPIQASVDLAAARYTSEFGAYRSGLTLENVQARERGKILMEVSNDQQALVISTGNKTEYALGYTTLYGDMCGGLAVLGDVNKPEVYALGRQINKQRAATVIPERTFTRPPSAELREGQVDPFDYPRIGPLADLAVEEHLSAEELAGRGYAREEVEMVLRLVRLNEYKRRQAPPILRVTHKAFGPGRRMPIVNHYKGY